MKTIKLLFISAVVGISSFVLSGNALAFFTDLVPVDIPDKAVVELVAPNNLTALINIANPKGDIFYNESVTMSDALTRYYDFTNLKGGIYTFYSSEEYSTTTKKIRVEGSSVEILSKEVDYKPVFSVKGKHLNVNYFNKKMEEIEFVIDGKYDNFYQDNEGNTISFGKQFDISKLPRGVYYALMNVGGKQYYHKFNVE
jgi:hypothetical protein